MNFHISLSAATSPIVELDEPRCESLGDFATQACPVSEVAVLNRLMLQKTIAAIRALPLHQRETLTLVCIEGYSYSEASAYLQIAIGTVMSRIHMARRQLRAELIGGSGDMASSC